jgi:RNA polymerase sigma-70 factor, ECF subfamily
MIDRQTFIEAYDAYSDAIFRHCFYRVYDRELAKDLMQNTFMKAWKSIEGGTEVEHLKAFLYKVANNLIVDHVRRKSSTSLEDLMEKGFDPSEEKGSSLGDQIDAKEAVKVLKDLKPKYREVVLLRFIQDLSPPEISEILGIKENAVSVRLNRALKQLRNLLSND